MFPISLHWTSEDWVLYFVLWHLFVIVLLNFTQQQGWFLDFAYHYLAITKARLIIQAYFKYLLMIMIIFFGTCSYTAFGHLSVENIVQVFGNIAHVLFCWRNTGVLRCRLCLFNTVIKRHIALPPNLESPSPRSNRPFFPFGWRLYIS